MKETIKNLQDWIDRTIYNRGANYYRKGLVKDLTTADDLWTAVVRGSKNYKTSIEIIDDEVVTWNCSCPYGGVVCKHVVAVLLEIEKNIGEEDDFSTIFSDEDKKTLLKLLMNDKFTFAKNRKGLELYKKNHVIKYKEDSEGIEATVIDLGEQHEVTISFLEEYGEEGMEVDCSCKNSTCTHQAAVIHKTFDELKKGAKKSIQPHQSKPKSKPKVVAKKPKFELTGRNAQEYRLLPIIDGNLEATLEKYKSKTERGLSWNEEVMGVFIAPNELAFHTESPYSFSFTPSKKVNIKTERGALYVKCLSCQSTRKKLCEHQTTILYKLYRLLAQLDLEDLSKFYESKFSEIAARMRVTSQVAKKYYEIITHNSEILEQGKELNVMNTDWVDMTKYISEGVKDSRKEQIREKERQLAAGQSERFAFVWHHSEGEAGRIEIAFGKGEAYKSKEGIKGLNNGLIGRPKGFPKELRGLGQQLYFLTEEEHDEERFVEIRDLIQANVDTLNSVYQYAYHGSLTMNLSPRASELTLFKFEPTPLECKIIFREVDGLTEVVREITHEGKPFNMNRVVYFNDIFCVQSGKGFFFPNASFQQYMTIFPEKYDNVILPNLNIVERTDLIRQFEAHFEVEKPKDYDMKEEVLGDGTLQILLREAGDFVLFEPRISFGEHSINAFDSEAFFIDDQLFVANEEDQTYLLDFLKKSHPNFNQPVQVQEYVYLNVREMLSNYWFLHFNEACEAAGIEVLGQKNLSKFNYSKHRAKTHMHIKSGINWFGVDAGLSFGKEKIKTADWIRALRNKETFIKLKDGSLGILPEEWLTQARKVLAVADIEKGELKISKYRFNIIEELFEEIDDQAIIKELNEKKARLLAIDTNKKYALPANINAKLRDYQKHGFEWLKFLDESEFGGILADDMGLGKTLQVITLLADQINQPPSLVVVPRSLLFNWMAELDKFCPDLTYTLHHGPKRANTIEAIQDYNIIITTYNTAANDVNMFKDFRFNYIILDESQAIKNPDSKRYKALRLLQSRNKLAMTGTPIENNTFDLYSQLSFTSPGLLGSKTSFKESFSVPIDNEGDKDAATLLKKLTYPFILRRTKEQVAKDLPSKTETVIYCEMGTAQRKLYEKLKTKIADDIHNAVEEDGLNKSKFKILDGLLRLRQMCNSPLLVNPSFKGVNAESVKMDMLVEKLTEALEQKHNALVFSQFVSLLTIVRERLDKQGIKYAYLDGSTRKRQAEVDKFMNNDEVKVFLISIKAGNTGLNLTKADYVYILDPWWNPAVEAQAIDRTHRIGQKNQIFAYKLICKNSIEEKILQLQNKKKKLADDIISTDENVLKSLDKTDLMALFE